MQKAIKTPENRVSWLATAIANGFDTVEAMIQSWVDKNLRTHEIADGLGLEYHQIRYVAFKYQQHQNIRYAPRSRKKTDWDAIAKTHGFESVKQALRKLYITIDNTNPNRCGIHTLSKIVGIPKHRLYEFLREYNIPVAKPGPGPHNSNGNTLDSHYYLHGFDTEEDMIKSWHNAGMTRADMAKAINKRLPDDKPRFNNNHIRWRLVKYGILPKPKSRHKPRVDLQEVY